MESAKREEGDCASIGTIIRTECTRQRGRDLETRWTLCAIPVKLLICDKAFRVLNAIFEGGDAQRIPVCVKLL